tara:strand:- start:3053 stop:3448 length:396 start_codon:yes stop_codon:yes gene_type:complete
MANKRRGYHTLKIGGKTRTLHFSMNFWSEFTDVLEVPLDKIGSVFEGGIKFSTIRALVYCGLLANDLEEGNDIEYNLYKVGFWLDEIESAQYEKIINSMTESKILGNSLNMGIERNPKTKEGAEGKQKPAP